VWRDCAHIHIVERRSPAQIAEAQKLAREWKPNAYPFEANLEFVS